MIEVITWASIKIFLKKSWLWCKKYWQILVGAAIPILAMVIFRKRGNVSKIIQRINDDYEKEIEIINETREQEIKDREKALSIYRDAITEIESKYSDDVDKLDEKKKRMIQDAIIENSKDPEAITRRISEITGFKIHVS